VANAPGNLMRHDLNIQAVVHAHPPHATAFAVAGLALDKAILSEVVLTLGCVPLADYCTPSTRELTDAICSLPRISRRSAHGQSRCGGFCRNARKGF
jgi:ribulose-5-phosphate 4-epimerase/fuculose-1-phosphate aldolase